MTATAETTPAPDVPCPACMAVPQADCLTPSGRATRPHAARLRLAPLARPAVAVDSAGQATTAPAPEPAPLPVRANRDDLARDLLILKVLLARITEVDADLRAQGGKAFRQGDQVPGYLCDDDADTGVARCLGRVGMSKPREGWKITDVDALTAWVAANHPDEIETRPVIRNSFLGTLTAACKAHGGWLNKTTGQVAVPPGIELVLGRPVLSVRLSDEAERLVTEAMATGALAFDGTGLRPALPAGGPS